VVAERDHVSARRQHPLRELRRDADAVGEVLAVQDAEVGAELVAEAGEALLDRPSSGAPDHVPDEQDSQGMLTVAAGWTSSDTLLPASCV
jgi:hypothetical protein